MKKEEKQLPDMFSDLLVKELEYLPGASLTPLAAIEQNLRTQVREYFDEIQDNIRKEYLLSLEELKKKANS